MNERTRNEPPPSDLDAVASALPESRGWSSRPAEADLKPLPAVPAVYLLLDGNGAAIQLATTQDLRRVLISRLVAASEAAGRADVGAIARQVRWREVHSAFEGRWWYYLLARRMHPRGYRKLVSFGPAWFLNVDWTEAVPEIRVSERVFCGPGAFLGPWPSRAACTRAMEGLRDLFDLCRYPEEVRRAPGGTRCAYADMGRCDAPCDGSVPMSSYAQRTREAWAFARGAARPWREQAVERMQQAATEQRYEAAALLKQQIALVDAEWLAADAPRVVDAERMRYLLAIPVTRRKKWKLFLFDRGRLAEGPVLPDKLLADEAAVWTRDAIGGEGAESPGELEPVVRMEQTWLAAHFLQHKEGQGAIVEMLGQRGESPAERLAERLNALRRGPASS